MARHGADEEAVAHVTVSAAPKPLQISILLRHEIDTPRRGVNYAALTQP
jgi:hypothetical protein